MVTSLSSGDTTLLPSTGEEVTVVLRVASDTRRRWTSVCCDLKQHLGCDDASWGRPSNREATIAALG